MKGMGEGGEGVEFMCGLQFVVFTVCTGCVFIQFFQGEE